MPDTLKLNMLTGIKVLELTNGLSGAYAGRLLACSGAEVTKISYKTSISAYRDEGKHIVKAKDQTLYAEIQKLLKKEWNIILWDNHISELNSYLIDFANTMTDTIKIFIDFPEEVDMDEEKTLQGIGGWMELTGSPDKPPLAIGGYPATTLVGAHAATAGILALTERNWNSPQEIITICALSIMVSGLEGAYSNYIATGVIRNRPGNRHHSITPMSICKSADGWVLVGAPVEEQWELLSSWAGLPEMEEWQSAEGRKQHSDAIEKYLSQWASHYNSDELFINGQTFRMPFAKVQSIEEIKECPQLKYRNFITSFENEKSKVPLPWKIYSYPVSQNLAFQPSAWKDIQILDLTNMWSGPYCTRLFADLGAEVIKVEASHRPDGIRAGEDNSKPFFRELNRNKKGIQLDLRVTADRNKLLKLVQDSDILIENFSPRVMRNFGLTAEKLWEYQPSLAVISLSAFGQTGPYQHFVGYGPTLETIAGIASLTHYSDGAPNLPGFSISDIGAGIHSAFILAAVIYQKKLHNNRYRVDLSQYEVACQFIGDYLIDSKFISNTTKPININNVTNLKNNYKIQESNVPGGSPVLGSPWYKKNWNIYHCPPPSLN